VTSGQREERLAEIKRWLANSIWPSPRRDATWLIGQLDYLLKRERYLLALLKRLEWRGCVEHFECPACGRRELDGHTPDCWLAAALAEQEEATRADTELGRDGG